MVQLCLGWMLAYCVVIGRCCFVLGIIMYGVLCSGGCGIRNGRVGWFGFLSKNFIYYY
jgi:hypothetical protein